MAFTTGVLTGTYKTFDDQPASGVVEIIPNSQQLIDAEGDVILAGRVKATLDAAGSFSVTLPATDDATVEPATGRQYTVVAKLKHTHLPAVTFTLPGGTTLDVADASDATATAAASSVWLTEEEYVALDATVSGHVADTANPHAVTKAQVGLANVDNVSAAALRDRATHTGTQPVASITGLADVATTGAYGDLTGTPAIPATAADVGAEPAGLSAETDAALSASYADWVNARGYGATGNGTTDDTAAIQAAITAAGEGGAVFLPAGDYLISSALSIPYDRFTLSGPGYRSATLRLANGANSSVITTPDDGVQRYALLLKDFAIHGNAANQTGTPHAVHIRGMNEARLEGLYILEPRGAAIYIGQATEGIYNTVPMITGCVIRGDATNSQTDAISLQAGSSDGQIIGNDVGFFTNGAGLVLAGHDGALVSHNNMWQCKFGFQNYAAHRTRFTGNLSDYAKQHGFVMQLSNDLQFDNCQARESSITSANTHDGFHFLDANDLSVSNCRAMGSQQRVGISFQQNIARARVVGGNMNGNAIAPNVVGAGCSDYRILACAGIADVTVA